MIRVAEGQIDENAVADAVRGADAGALLTFAGVTRNTFEGRPVLRLSYEALVPLAELELTRIVSQAVERWPGVRVAIVHRLGDVPVGDTSVCVAVSAPHRAAAYEASRFVIDTLKLRVPIWKKEVYADGASWKANE